MAAQQSIPTIIGTAKVSQYMVNQVIANGSLSGQKLDPNWGLTLYMERKALEWMYGKDPNYPSLRAVADYVLWLCYKANQALIIYSGGGGGTPVIPTGGGSGQYYILPGEVTVIDVAGQPANGTFTWTNINMVGATQLAYIMVDGVVETIANGQFTFDPASGTITRSQVWITGSVVLAPFLRAF